MGRLRSPRSPYDAAGRDAAGVSTGALTIDAAVAEVVARLQAPGGAGVLVVAPGGWGTTSVLARTAASDELAEVTADEANVLRLTGRRFEQSVAGAGLRELGIDPDDPVAASRTLLERAAAGALLVDDAHWLDDVTLQALVGAAERLDGSEARMVVGQRPVSSTLLGALGSALARSSPAVRLGPLDQDDVSGRLAQVLETAVDVALVEAAHDASGGVPYALDAVVAGWGDDGLVVGGRLAPPVADGEAAEAVPSAAHPDERWSPSVVERTRPRIDALAPEERAVLEALALGPSLDDDLLASAAAVPADQVAPALAGLRAAGLLLEGHDEPVPLVCGAVAALVPDAERRRLHDRLARALLARGGSPVPAAEHLVAAGSSGPEVAEALLAAARATLAESPSLASALLARAVELGVGPEAAVAQGRVLVVTGDLEGAVRVADPLLAEPDDAVRAEAAAVLAAACAGLGRWSRAAGAALASDSPEGQATAAVAVLAGGRRTGEGEAGADAGGSPAPAAVEVVRGLAAAATAAADGDAEGAVAAALAAADLLERAPGAAVLPETPHALGAMVALVAGNEATASLLLRRAVASGVGGERAETRHRLLAAWVAMRTGRWAQARSAIAAASPAPGSRDEVVRHALRLGIARREGDVAGLADAWRAAEPDVLTAEPDLLLLEVWTEVAVSAARLEHAELAQRPLDVLGRVVDGLGRPALWSVPLEWGRLVAAVAAIDPAGASDAAASLADLEPVSPALAGLAPAARVWADVLGGEVDLAALDGAVAGLELAGRPWEASRLAGHAAVRVDDADLARSLLGQARELKGGLPTGETGSTPSTGESVLSDREREVARLVLDGLTHKEVGAQLYISPKTVEHHVAKIRQKLGASTRAEMMAALRTELS